MPENINLLETACGITKAEAIGGRLKIHDPRRVQYARIGNYIDKITEENEKRSRAADNRRLWQTLQQASADLKRRLPSVHIKFPRIKKPPLNDAGDRKAMQAVLGKLGPVTLDGHVTSFLLEIAPDAVECSDPKQVTHEDMATPSGRTSEPDRTRRHRSRTPRRKAKHHDEFTLFFSPQAKVEAMDGR